MVEPSAPGATRTHTGRILSPLPLPIGLRGRDVRLYATSLTRAQ
jgi:hypothetical protein